jgi:hypothetical protein
MTTPAGTPFDRSVLIGLAVLLEVAIVLFALALDWRPSLAIGVGPVTGSAVAVVISALVVPLTTSAIALAPEGHGEAHAPKTTTDGHDSAGAPSTHHVRDRSSGR